jgi:Protein of unknown function (DUF1364)
VIKFPKSPRQQNRALLDMARGKPCLIRSPLCNDNPETTVACHGSGVANGKGMGYKVHDWLTVWGCSDCNHYTDAYSGATAEEKRRAWELGHVRQIIEWNKIMNQVNGQESNRDIEAALWALENLGEINENSR